MTDKMKDFIKILELARRGEDEGIKLLKSSALKQETAVSKRFGSVYLTYVPILMVGSFSVSSNSIRDDLYCCSNNTFYYTERVRFQGIKTLNNKSVLGEPFQICIVHNMERVLAINIDEFEVLVEKCVDIFVVTRYGCFDLFTSERIDIPNKYAIEESFKNEKIVVYPSNKSVFARDLNRALFKELDFEKEDMVGKKSHIVLNCKLKGSTSFDDKVKYLSSVYINNKYFCELKCNYQNDATITIKGDNTKDIVFDSSVSVFGIKTKISSELLASRNDWSTQNTSAIDDFPVFNFKLIKNIGFSKISNGIDDIKNKFYFDLVCSRSHRNIERMIKEDFMNYELTFKERISNQFTFGKMLFLNSHLVDQANSIYAVSLYSQYITTYNNKLYKVNEILFENKLENNVFLVSLLEMGCQVKTVKSNFYFPVLYFIPCTVLVGSNVDNILKNGLSSSYIFDKRVKKYIYDKIIETYGNIYFGNSILGLDFTVLDQDFCNIIKAGFEDMRDIDITSDLESDVLQFMHNIS